MTKRIRIILIIAIVILLSGISATIGLTAAIWQSAGGESEYGPVIRSVDWNSWVKYFDYDSMDSSVIVGFHGTNLEDVIFPAQNDNVDVVTIKNSVFSNTTTKELPVTIYISGSIEVIEAGAFSNLPNLQQVVFAPGPSVALGDYMFSGCRSLKEIVIQTVNDETPAREVVFGDYALAGCTALETIYYQGTKAQWTSLMSNFGSHWCDGSSDDFVVYCMNDSAVDKTITKASLLA